MKNKSLFTMITSSLALLTVIPGRFAVGLIALLLLNILVLCGMLSRVVLANLGYSRFSRPIILVVQTGITIIFQQLLYLFSPVIALTMSFSVYVVCFSSLLMGVLFTAPEETTSDVLLHNTRSTLFFSLWALLFFLVRDFLGFGTISFPIPSGLLELQLLNSFDGVFFFGSIPGAFMLLAAVLIIEYFLCHQRNRA